MFDMKEEVLLVTRQHAYIMCKHVCMRAVLVGEDHKYYADLNWVYGRKLRYSRYHQGRYQYKESV